MIFGTFMVYQNFKTLAVSTLATGIFFILFTANPGGGLAIFTETGINGAFFGLGGGLNLKICIFGSWSQLLYFFGLIR